MRQNSRIPPRRFLTPMPFPMKKRVTPSVFLPDRALIGAEKIKDNLNLAVSLGLAVGEISTAPTAADEPATSSIWGTLIAGLVAGFNGCALSMLLMFVSIVLSIRKNAWPYVAAFLLSKLACYLLIGYVLLSLLQAINPTGPWNRCADHSDGYGHLAGVSYIPGCNLRQKWRAGADEKSAPGWASRKAPQGNAHYVRKKNCSSLPPS